MMKITIIAALGLMCCLFTTAAAQDTDVETVYKEMVASFTERDLDKRWIPHTDLVLARAKRLLEVIDADARTTLIGAILHDIGKGNDDHEKAGAVIAEELLIKLSMDKKLIKTIYTTVENHHKAQCELADEFVIVWLADRLRTELPEDDKELVKLYNETKVKLQERKK